jgi:allantoinase
MSVPEPTRELVIRSRRVVTPGAMGPAAVHVRGETIAAVADHDEVPAGAELLDFGELVVMPGLVDTHVHLNEPGRTEWEGFATGTRAAAAGGVTTLVEMPLNSIPATTTAASLVAKVAAAGSKLAVDIGFWGGVVPGNADDLAPLWEAGAFGFKCFLAPSGVDEFPHVGEADLEAALPTLAALGAPLLAHAELPARLEEAAAALSGGDPRRHDLWLASRPRAAENDAVELLLALCRRHGARVHVVHVSSHEALAPLARARAEGLPVSAETCPHYLTFAAEEVPDGATAWKCAPPIRERANNERLWQALAMGVLEMVVTDHSPCPPAMKQLASGDFLRAWGGIAALELSLPAVWTGAAERGLELHRLADWMAAAPAALAGLAHRKGSLAAGRDADLVVFDPDASFVVDPARLHQRHPITPYAGRTLRGRVAATFLRGRRICEHGEPVGPPGGSVLLRGHA